MGIHIADRKKSVPAVNEVLSKSGCAINTRVGLHSNEDGACSPSGVILLSLDDTKQSLIAKAFSKLNRIKGVEVQLMTFD
ncbi:hypothetical protein PCE1_001028 [Barthelona sp. PCE]